MDPLTWIVGIEYLLIFTFQLSSSEMIHFSFFGIKDAKRSKNHKGML